MGVSEEWQRIEEQRLLYVELAEYSKWAARRDEIIERAMTAGIPPRTVAVCMRLSRAHLYKIVKDRREARDATT